MAKWNDTVLSTIESITTWERELPNLCGIRTDRLLKLASGNVFTLAVISESIPGEFFSYSQDSVKSGVAYMGNGGEYPISEPVRLIISVPAYVLDQSAFLNKIDIMISADIECAEPLLLRGSIDFRSLQYSDDTADIVVSMSIINRPEPLPGNGAYTYEDVRIAYVLSMPEASKWVETVSGGNWDDKIANAKTIVGLDLEKKLRDKNIRVDEADGEVLLDVVANPTTFSIASDYKCIQLIYDDLAESSISYETYQKKAMSYRERYRDELQQAWLRINLDLSLDGDVEIYRADFIGEIER